MTTVNDPAPALPPESEYVTFPGLHQNPDIIAAVSSQAPLVTDEHVAMVLKALYLVQNGDPVGTVLSNPETGEIALRVSHGGVHQWRVTDPEGHVRTELATTLPGWTVLQTAAPAEE